MTNQPDSTLKSSRLCRFLRHSFTRTRPRGTLFNYRIYCWPVQSFRWNFRPDKRGYAFSVASVRSLVKIYRITVLIPGPGTEVGLSITVSLDIHTRTNRRTTSRCKKPAPSSVQQVARKNEASFFSSCSSISVICCSLPKTADNSKRQKQPVEGRSKLYLVWRNRKNEKWNTAAVLTARVTRQGKSYSTNNSHHISLRCPPR